MRFSAARWVLVLSTVASLARAEAPTDRFSAGGYFRIMTRPDFQGGNGTLGYSDLYGRLLNEGPYAALELKLDVLQNPPGRNEVWASIHAKVEGGSVRNADPNNGVLSQFRLSRLYVEAGNILFDHVTWSLGTLDFWPGVLGLYDARPVYLFYDTVGLSARYDHGPIEFLIGIGDSGFALHGASYDFVGTAGAWLRLRLGDHVELGTGGEGRYEPSTPGNQFAPYTTPGVTYSNYIQQQVVKSFFEANPNVQVIFPDPVATDASSFQLNGYLGFGKWGPLLWNNLFVNFQRLHPLGPYTETFNGVSYPVYITNITNKRYQFQAGDEAQITLVPGRLDAVWAALVGYNYDKDNSIQESQNNYEYGSTVLRLQLYLTQVVHLLLESSLAREISLNGNMFREHVDSIFGNVNGVPTTGQQFPLQFGDSPTRDTWQLKTGIVLNPNGPGIYVRPSIRLLYGLQYSSQQAAFGNGYATSLSQYNVFLGPEMHWHSVVALEAEEWF